MTPGQAFWHPVRVYFDHTDAQGRVFYAHYCRLIDQARCAFWEALGLTEAEVRQIEQDTVIVRLEVDYHGPAAFYDLLRIAVAVTHLGRSSVHLAYRVLHTETGREICTARTVLVQVDLATDTSRPWSAEFREAVERFQAPA